MMTDQPTHLRPFFPSADDFAAATAPPFDFLVTEFGYSDPTVTDLDGAIYEVRYDGEGTAVLLNWDVEGGFIGVHFVPRSARGHLTSDPEKWLRPNEILGARGQRSRWTTQTDLEGVDKIGYEAVLKREAANMREFCADVLRGDWSIYGEAHGWVEAHPEG
jgi:hypothetical protein